MGKSYHEWQVAVALGAAVTPLGSSLWARTHYFLEGTGGGLAPPAGSRAGYGLAKDPYSVLGVSRTADEDTIRAAFRKLAKKYHPDRNQGDRQAEERFKEIASAFDILGDPENRLKFDRGEIDEQGRDKAPFRQWRPGQGPGQGSAQGAGAQGHGAGMGGASFDDLSDIFSDLFGGGPRRAGSGAGQGMGAGMGGFGGRGRDMRYRLEIEFLEAVNGATKRVTMPDGRTLDIVVPAGLEDGQTLRLKGQSDTAGALAGDVYVEVKVKPHPLFDRDGADMHAEIPITLKEAVLGGKITVETISGDVAVTVPKNSSSGAVLRLKGRGAPDGKGGKGDQYVKLKIVLPEGGDGELEEFVRRWKGADVSVRNKADA